MHLTLSDALSMSRNGKVNPSGLGAFNAGDK